MFWNRRCWWSVTVSSFHLYYLCCDRVARESHYLWIKKHCWQIWCANVDVFIPANKELISVCCSILCIMSRVAAFLLLSSLQWWRNEKRMIEHFTLVFCFEETQTLQLSLTVVLKRSLRKCPSFSTDICYWMVFRYVRWSWCITWFIAEPSVTGITQTYKLPLLI